jgi:hypothetical protein
MNSRVGTIAIEISVLAERFARPSYPALAGAAIAFKPVFHFMTVDFMTFRLRIWYGWMICGFARDPAWPRWRRWRQVQPVPLVHAAKSAPTFFDEAIYVRSKEPLVSTSEPFLISHLFLGRVGSPSPKGHGAGEWVAKFNDRRLVRHVTLQEPRRMGRKENSFGGTPLAVMRVLQLEERWNRGTAQPNETRTVRSNPSPSCYSNFASFANWFGRQKQQVGPEEARPGVARRG